MSARDDRELVERLLPGEKPETLYADDVQHWCAVYQELLSGHRDLEGALAALGSEAIHERELVLVRAQIARLERRLAYWLDRQTRLDATEPRQRRSAHGRT